MIRHQVERIKMADCSSAGNAKIFWLQPRDKAAMLVDMPYVFSLFSTECYKGGEGVAFVLANQHGALHA